MDEIYNNMSSHSPEFVVSVVVLLLCTNILSVLMLTNISLVLIRF
jgi:hypothetical protein